MCLKGGPTYSILEWENKSDNKVWLGFVCVCVRKYVRVCMRNSTTERTYTHTHNVHATMYTCMGKHKVYRRVVYQSINSTKGQNPKITHCPKLVVLTVESRGKRTNHGICIIREIRKRLNIKYWDHQSLLIRIIYDNRWLPIVYL